MKPYCVTVVKYVLPAIRVLITKELLEKYGLRKIDIADKMSISPAAVTQYSKGIRGSSYVKEISGSEEIMKRVFEISEAVADEDANPESIMEKMCEVCRLIRSDKIICKLHADEFSDSGLDECTICMKDDP